MSDIPPPPSPDPVEDPDPAPDKPRRGKAPLVAGGLLALTAVVVAGVLVLVVGGNDDDPGDDDEETSEQEESEADDQGSGSSRSESSDGAGSAPARADDPEGVVRAYLDAFADEDCEAMAEFVTPDSLESEGLTPEEALRTCEEGFEADEAESFDIQDVELVDEADDTASVEVTATIEGETESTRFTLRRVDDDWLIDLTATDSTESDPDDEDT